MCRQALLLTVALAATAGPARADHLTMQVQQMAGSFMPGCQMGDPRACEALRYVVQMEQLMEQAYGACQQGDQNGCAMGQQAEARILSDYGRWQQANFGGGTAAPGYDPNNPLGATHQDRMDAISQFGSTMQGNFENRMQQMDIQQQQFLDTLSQ
jgi:hypothetical protein